MKNKKKKIGRVLVATLLILGMVGGASAASKHAGWEFDSSCPFPDETGNGYTASCVGSPTSDGNSVDLSTTGDYLNAPQGTMTMGAGGDWTVYGHIYLNQNSDRQAIIARWSANDFIFAVESGQYKAWEDGGANYQDGSIPANEWFKTIWTYDHSTSTLTAYVNNTQQLSWGSFDPPNRGHDIEIGHYGDGGNQLDGRIEEMRIYDYIVSSSERDKLVQCGETVCNNAPSIDSVSTEPSSWTLGSSINVSASVSDSDGTVSSVSASVWEDGTQIVDNASLSNTAGTTWSVDNLFTVDETDVYYNLTLTATDDKGATDTYDLNQYINDSTAGLKAAKPKNGSYYQDPAPYDIYLNDDGDDVENESATCTLYANGNSFDTVSLNEGGSHLTGTLPNLGTGNHSFSTSCTEDEGNSTLSDVYREFTVDNDQPDLNITHPISKLEIKNNIDLNYTVSDFSPLSQCTYNIDGEANATLSSCENATFSRNEVGEHTVNLWATDEAGNTAFDTQNFTADYRNTVELDDKDTGSSIGNFSVVLQDGTTLGGSTSSGTFEFFTLEMPKGDVNMTLKSDGYQTRTVEFQDVDKTFELNQVYEMTRAGIYIDAIDEQSREDINFDFVARNSTASFNKTNITEFDQDLDNVPGFPTGEVTITISHPDDEYRPRQYFLTVNENTRAMLTSYLLKRGQGLFTSVEVVDEERNAVKDAQISIQKLYGTNWKTVVQKRTTSSGGQSFYLDPDISYRAYVTHPDYVSFQGTFSPANYQYEPLTIQLGTSDAYNFTTRWDSISYKLDPDTNTLEGEGTQDFNWTIIDSRNELTEFGLKFWHDNQVKDQNSVKDSPSGGTVSLSQALGNYSDGERVKLQGYFQSDGEFYSVNRTYVVRKGFDQGVFSINAIFYELKQALDDTGEALVALIVTFLVGLGTGKTRLGGKEGGGFIAIMVLGIFTWKKMFPGFIWILALLLLIGVWASRRV